MIAYCFATEVDYSDLTIAEVRGQFIISITEIENARRERIGTTLVEQTSVRESGEKLNVREAATVNVLRIYLRTYNPAAPEEIKDLLAQVKSIDTLVVNEFVTHLCIPIRLKKTRYHSTFGFCRSFIDVQGGKCICRLYSFAYAYITKSAINR